MRTQIKLEVEVTQNRGFSPTELIITILEKTEESVFVETVLTQITSTGSIVETSRREFPLSALSVLAGYDTELMQPTVDPIGINQLLANFGLKLK